MPYKLCHWSCLGESVNAASQAPPHSFWLWGSFMGLRIVTDGTWPQWSLPATLGVIFAWLLTLNSLRVHKAFQDVFLRKAEVPRAQERQTSEFPTNGKEPSSQFLLNTTPCCLSSIVSRMSVAVLRNPWIPELLGGSFQRNSEVPGSLSSTVQKGAWGQGARIMGWMNPVALDSDDRWKGAPLFSPSCSNFTNHGPRHH